MSNVTATRISALCCCLAVALGAFGAHGLRGLLESNQTASTWETAVLYHFLHALALLLLAGRSPLPKGPWFSLLGGIIVFSGSLYLLALTNIRWLGAITPLGGVGFLVGWLWLALQPADKPK